MVDSLGHLVYVFIRTGPVQDPHPEQVKEDWIVDTSPISLSKPFCPSDHIGPKTIVEEQVWVHIPPPPVMNDSLIIQFSRFYDHQSL